jgi:peroxiredoxin
MAIQLSRRWNGARGLMQKTSQMGIRATTWCLCCLLVASLLLTQGGATAADKFRPFKLKTLDGTPKTLQDFANKATLISFFYPRCPYCAVALPEVQKIYDKYKDKGLSVVWINVLPDENKLIAKWQAEQHFTVPVLIGASQESLQRDYRLTTTPTDYLLGEKGEVLLYQSGYKPGDEKILESKISEALNIAP